MFKRTPITLLLAILLAAPPGWAAEDLADPTRPAWARSSNDKAGIRAPGWKLSSIVVGETRRVAVINDEAVGIGDVVNGATVMEILPYAVTLRRNGRDFTLTLLDGNVKTRS